MKPVAIFRFFTTEGPGHFATFMDAQRIPWRLFKLDAGDAVPQDIDAWSGFVFMGGPMSVNDDLPWIPPMLNLIRDAIAADKPCLGHCLGGQLISKALGGVVSKNPVMEIGWNPVRVEDSDTARDWLGNDLHEWTTFQWHGETFTIPPGASRILSGGACANQAYVIGKSLGMQCHVEMTEEMVKAWCETGAGEIAASLGPTVQSAEAMQQDLAGRVAALNQVAERLYTKWIAGLVR